MVPGKVALVSHSEGGTRCSQRTVTRTEATPASTPSRLVRAPPRPLRSSPSPPTQVPLCPLVTLKDLLEGSSRVPSLFTPPDGASLTRNPYFSRTQYSSTSFPDPIRSLESSSSFPTYLLNGSRLESRLTGSTGSLRTLHTGGPPFSFRKQRIPGVHGLSFYLLTDRIFTPPLLFSTVSPPWGFYCPSQLRISNLGVFCVRQT